MIVCILGVIYCNIMLVKTEVTSKHLNMLLEATQLGYPDEVITKLKQAKTDGEINRIMMNTRKEKFG